MQPIPLTLRIRPTRASLIQTGSRPDPARLPPPQGRTPFQTYLTVAYKPCVSPNEQHGAPLAVLSCYPPQQASNFLTVGTLDANGQDAKSVGSYRLDVKRRSRRDVKITFSIKDVRNKPDLSTTPASCASPRTGGITDRYNGPTGGGARDPRYHQDIPFAPLDVRARPPPPTTRSARPADLDYRHAIIPGQVPAGARMNSELGQVQVYDGGSDPDADTTADNTLFMDQGIFVP